MILLDKLNLKSLNVCIKEQTKRIIKLPNNIYKINNLTLEGNFYIDYFSCNLQYHKSYIMNIKYDIIQNIYEWRPCIINIKRLCLDKNFRFRVLNLLCYSEKYLCYDAQCLIIEYLIVVYFI